MPMGPFGDVDPASPAIVVEPSGVVVTYAELEARSNQAAHLLRARGLGPGARVAILAKNRAKYSNWPGRRSVPGSTTWESTATSPRVRSATSSATAAPSWWSRRQARRRGHRRADRPHARTRRLMFGNPATGGRATTTRSRLVGDTDPRRVRRRLHAVLLGHSPAAPRASGGRYPVGRWAPIRTPLDDGCANCSGSPRRHLSLARSALPRRPARLVHERAPERRDRCGPREVRRGTRTRGHRAASGDPQPVGPDDVHPPAQASRRDAGRYDLSSLRHAVHAAAPSRSK